MIQWPRRREARPLEPKIRVNPRLLELQTAKEILAEIFHARPGDVEEMIQIRLALPPATKSFLASSRHSRPGTWTRALVQR